MDKRLDVSNYALFLPDLVTKRNLESSMDRGPLGYPSPADWPHTNVHSRIPNRKVLQSAPNLLASRRRPRQIGTFIQSVNDDIDWALPWQVQHVLHTFFERVNIELSHAVHIV